MNALKKISNQYQGINKQLQHNIRTICFYILCVVSLQNTFAQVGIGTTTPNASSVLDITATDKGILIPRMTQAQKNAISSPATGLLIFQSDGASGFYYYNGIIWLSLSSAKNTLDQAYDEGGAGAGRTIIANDGAVTITGSDGFSVTGFSGVGDLIIAGNGSRMYYNPRKGAFRAGNISGTQWDDGNVGLFSAALGYNALASGDSSMVFGHNSSATGNASIAMGNASVASNISSTAIGNNTTASGNNSLAMGYFSIASSSYATAIGDGSEATAVSSIAIGHLAQASANYSISIGRENLASNNSATAIGQGNNASGINATAFGHLTTASGNHSTTLGLASQATGEFGTSIGYFTTASGKYSLATGSNNTASGERSTTLGYTTSAPSYGETALGIFNSQYTPNSATTFDIADRLFVIGNGDGGLSSNALTIYKSGLMNINDEYNMPLTDGTTNQVMQTDGSGNVNWATISATDTQNTLDQAYDEGGPGVGRQINADNGSVFILKNSTSVGSALLARSTSLDVFENKSAIEANNTFGGLTSNLAYFKKAAGSDPFGFYGLHVTSIPSNYANIHGAFYDFNVGSGSDVVGSRVRINSSGVSGAAFNVFGFKSELYGASETQKYAFHASIPTASNGIHYGFYADVKKNTSYAGYFLGRVSIGSTTVNNYILPTSRGTANQIMQTDGSGNVNWATISITDTQNTLDQAYDEGGVGIGRTITADAGAVNIEGTDGFQVLGTQGSGTAISLSGAGTRMFFNPLKAAFRAGYVNGNQWNNANIGNYSVAMGRDTRASGEHSTALGREAIASGSQSVALGKTTTSSGNNTMTIGNNIIAPSFSEVVVGRFNTTYTVSSTSAWNTSDRLFVVGNGANSSNLSNALTIFKDGKMIINGNVGVGRNPVTNALELEGEASKTTAGAFIANSDERLKSNINSISGEMALKKLSQLRGVTYLWNDTKTGTKRPESIQYGFIAQELMQVFPEKVTKDNLGYYQTAYGDYDAFFVEAIKALHTKIANIEKENQKLKELISNYTIIEARLSAIEQKQTSNNQDTAMVVKQ